MPSGKQQSSRQTLPDFIESNAREISIKALFDALPVAIFVKDHESRFLLINKACEEQWGVSFEEVRGTTGSSVFPPDMMQRFLSKDREVFQDGRQENFIEAFWNNKLQASRVGHTFKKPMYDAEGNPLCLICATVDITEQHQAEQDLRISENKLRGLYELSPLGIALTDMQGRFVEFNEAFRMLCGYAEDELKQLDYWELTPREYEAQEIKQLESLSQNGRYGPYEKNYRRKSGDLVPIRLNGILVSGRDGKEYIWSIAEDISSSKKHEEQLERIAHYDALTGIPNRVLLTDRMKQAMAQTVREQTMLAVCYLDLDGFKPINDQFGHEAGDQVLIEIAKRLERTVRGGDTVARLGGDEFVVLLLGLERGVECVTTLSRMLATISEPITVMEKVFSLSASIGVSIYPLDNEDMDTLLRHADQAMYVAKMSGKNRYHLHDAEHDQRVREHMETRERIRLGLQKGEFELFYQPKIDMHSGRMSGAEALIRWRHPERGLLAPFEFLRLAENTPLDIEIGEWVISSALGQIMKWRQAGMDVAVSVNISAYHLESPDFITKLKQQLANYPDMPAGLLQIEVLESAALEDIASVSKIIEACRNIGVGFALDDFGTGYSSLLYLSHLPVDTLKVDQSFVRSMLDDKGDRLIVQGVIALARPFGLHTVAEGVETLEHYRMLMEMGCDVGQGYVIARPMPADKLLDWSASYNQDHPLKSEK